MCCLAGSVAIFGNMLSIHFHVCLYILVCYWVLNTDGCKKIFPSKKGHPKNTNRPTASVVISEPLYVTPLIKRNEILEAQKLAYVKKIANIESYSGFFTVNEKCNRHLFFWFIPAHVITSWDRRTTFLWIQGEPGVSSMFGIFQEMGPFMFKGSDVKERVKGAWHTEYNVLYLDYTAGVGYSHAKPECFAKSIGEVGQDLYEATIQFFKLFPNLKEAQRDINSKFIIGGEYMAGLYIPALGHLIHTDTEQKLRLDRIIIGNGWIDPIIQSDYTSILPNLRIPISDSIKKYQKNVRDQIQNKEWESAAESLASLRLAVKKSGGITDLRNYKNKNKLEISTGQWTNFVQRGDIRNNIHVGSLVFSNGNEAVRCLKGDIARTSKQWIEELVEHYDIIWYSGELDLLCEGTLLEKALDSLQWSGKATFNTASKQPWYFNYDGTTEVTRKNGHKEMIPVTKQKTVGNYKRAAGLYAATVFEAGHHAAMDKIDVIYSMMLMVVRKQANKDILFKRQIKT